MGWPTRLALLFTFCSYPPMSYLGHTGRDLLIPPRPAQISMAAPAKPWMPVLRLTPSKPRLGPVQEASLVGIVALSLCWAAGEIAFLLWG